jgi:hypothetical protein
MMIEVAEWRADILQEHVEVLEGLWNRRLLAERSGIIDGLALRRLDARIEAHADAIMLAGGPAIRFVEPLYAAEEPAPAAAAAYLTGRSDAPALIELLVKALPAMPPEARPGVWTALSIRAGLALRDALAKLTADAELQAGILAVLAAHEDPRAASMQPERFLLDASPAARILSWRAVRRLGEAIRIDPAYYQHGLMDAEAAVRRAALEAAVPLRQPALLDWLRQLAATPDLVRLEEHLLFAILAPAAEVPAVVALGSAPALGWDRYRVLTFCGRAPAVEALLAVMRAGDKVEGALAGAAFYRITGADVAAGDRVPLVPAGTEPDDFSDEVQLCDVEKAEKAWKALKGPMAGARWAYGIDAEVTPPESFPDEADLESRWAAELRASFTRPKRRLRFDHERLFS